MSSVPVSAHQPLRHVALATLATELNDLLEAVRRGETVVVEDESGHEAAIVDVIDWQILRAAARYYADPPAIDREQGLSDQQVSGMADQELYDVAMAYYLADAISLSRLAELVRGTWIDLRSRFSRLGLPVHTAPTTEDELRADVHAAGSVIS